MSCETTDYEINRIFLRGDNTTLLDISQNSPPCADHPYAINIKFSSGTGIADVNDNQSLDDDLMILDDDLIKGFEFANVLPPGENDFIWDQLFGDCSDINKNPLTKLDQSITDRIMLVDVQPPENIRYRYESDGKRQIEKSRSKPMTIRLPDFKNCQIDATESIWLQISLITTDQNPLATEFIHAYRLEYHEEGSMTTEDGTVRVLLKSDDISKQIKQLARISIIKKRLDKFDFKLKPYTPLSSSPANIETYEITDEKSAVAKAKFFRDIFHLESGRIACQILFRKNNDWYMTDMVCKTNVMEEKPPIVSNKRSPSAHTINEEERMIKKAKLTVNTLPITRV